MRRISVVVTVGVLLAQIVAVASPAAAAPTTSSKTFALQGSTGPQVLGAAPFVHCDGCAPDDLFSCGGCEITAGIALKPTLSFGWAASAAIETTYDPAQLHQGQATGVSNELTPGAGTVTVRYSLEYAIGLFGKGGDFPADWTPTQEWTYIDTIQKTASTPCTPPLGGTTTCNVDASIVIFPETCVGPPGCLVDITVSLIVKHQIVVGPSGIVSSRTSTFIPKGDLSFEGAAPATKTDPFTVPCSATVGSSVTYVLDGLTYSPTLDVDGTIALGINIDGPGPANAEEVIDLFKVKLFQGTIPMSSGDRSEITLGPVLPDDVAPVVSAAITNNPIDEGGSARLLGSVTDNCSAGATIDWGDGGPLETVPAAGPSLTLDEAHRYGDNGSYTVTVCGTDGYATPCKTATVAIANVNPTADILNEASTLPNGASAIFARANEPVTFSARSTDPGSDDLTLRWDWGDGAPSPDVTTVSLVNPPLADPPNSPSLQPRDVPDEQVHAFADACLYTISLFSTDDDGGTASDSATVVIVGRASAIRSAGYWQTQFESKGTKDFSQARLACYLAVVGYLSDVFHEVRNVATIALASKLLKMGDSGGDLKIQFDRQLLALWLNFANGSVTADRPVDTNGDKVADSTVGEVLAAAEAARLNPATTARQLEAAKNLIEAINLGRA